MLKHIRIGRRIMGAFLLMALMAVIAGICSITAISTLKGAGDEAGSAVIAEEVRNLAMRSAEAARSTADMIEASSQNAGKGVILNQEVLENLNDINIQVNRVGEMMSEVSTASEQQSFGIEQINLSIEQMNQMTQSNAANAEESAGASEELGHQADRMRNLVESFVISDSTGRRPGHESSYGRSRQMHLDGMESWGGPCAVAAPAGISSGGGNGRGHKNNGSSRAGHPETESWDF